MEKEHISHSPGDENAWICICGNTPEDGGFFACDAKGAEVEPDEKTWLVPLYVCDLCGRIINQDTLEVVGRRVEEK